MIDDKQIIECTEFVTVETEGDNLKYTVLSGEEITLTGIKVRVCTSDKAYEENHILTDEQLKEIKENCTIKSHEKINLAEKYDELEKILRVLMGGD